MAVTLGSLFYAPVSHQTASPIPSSKCLPPSCVLSIFSGILLLWRPLISQLDCHNPLLINPSLHPRLSPLQFSPLKHHLTGIQEIFVISLASFKLFSTSNWNCHPSKIPLVQLSKQRSSPSSMVRDQNSHAPKTPHPSTSLHIFIHRLPPTRQCSSTCSLYRNHTCSSSSTEI